MLITSGGKPEVFHCFISGCSLGTRPGRHLSVFLTLPGVKMEISNRVPSNSAKVFIGRVRKLRN